MKTKDMIGKKFNSLFVFEMATPNRHGQGMLKCRCECGNICEIVAHDVSRNHTVSCGCKLKSRLASGTANRSHGMNKSPEHVSWIKMRERCYNPNLKIYKRYGAKGIKVCDRWKNSFENFFADLGHIPSPAHNTLDRIDNSKGYEPGNCRWATRKDQSMNRTSTIFMTHNNVTLCQQEWADKLGVTRAAIQYWIKKGDPISKIVEHFTPKASLA